MAEEPILQSRPLKLVEKYRGMLLPLGAMALIFVLLIPLPTPLLDFLLAATEMDFQQVQKYFSEKGMNMVFRWNEMVL